jgi:universal stress protein A
MDAYKIILAAVDLQPEHDKLTVERAQKLAKDNNAKLYIVHAIESLNAYGTAYGYPATADVQDELSKEHQQALLKEAKALGIEESQLIIDIGSANVVIVNTAKKIEADLIVVGAHSRHGLKLLIGSTTDSVLHHAPCDVLAVHF